jgi:aminobenzoyl-glutamate transport protein
VNILITPLDSLLTGVTNEAIGLVDPDESLGITTNLYFAVVSTLFTALVVTFVTQRFVEPRLGKFAPPVREAGEEDAAAASEPEPLAPAAEAKGLKWAMIGVAISVAAIALLTVVPGAPSATRRTATSSATHRSWTASPS